MQEVKGVCLLNDLVVSEGNSLLVDLAEPTLVDKLLDALHVGVSDICG